MSRHLNLIFVAAVMLIANGCFTADKPLWLEAYEEDGTGLVSDDSNDVIEDSEADVAGVNIPDGDDPDTEEDEPDGDASEGELIDADDAASDVVDAGPDSDQDSDGGGAQSDAGDAGEEDIAEPDTVDPLCSDDQVVACDGESCVESALLGDGVCDEQARCEALAYDGGDCIDQCGAGGEDLQAKLDAYWQDEVLTDEQLQAYYRIMFQAAVSQAKACAESTDASLEETEACLSNLLPALGSSGEHNPLHGFSEAEATDLGCTSCWVRLGIDFFDRCTDVLDNCLSAEPLDQAICEGCRTAEDSLYDPESSIAKVFERCSGIPEDALSPCNGDDCSSVCGDGTCDSERGESFETCSVDCLCGDGQCGDDESIESCATDCCQFDSACINKTCGWSETDGCSQPCGACGSGEICAYGGTCIEEPDWQGASNPCLGTLSALKIKHATSASEQSFEDALSAAWKDALGPVVETCGPVDKDAKSDCGAVVLLEAEALEAPSGLGALDFEEALTSSNESEDAQAECMTCLGEFSQCIAFSGCSETCTGYVNGALDEPSEECIGCLSGPGSTEACRTATICAGFRVADSACEESCDGTCGVADGCGGVCGCSEGLVCSSGVCEPVCGDGLCAIGEGIAECPQDCGPSSACCNPIEGESCPSAECVENVCAVNSECCPDNIEDPWNASCTGLAKTACQWLCQPETCGDGVCDCALGEDGATCPGDCPDRSVTLNVDLSCIDRPQNSLGEESGGEFAQLQVVRAESDEVLASVSDIAPEAEATSLTFSLGRCEVLHYTLEAYDGQWDQWFQEELIDDAMAKIAFQHPDNSSHHCAPDTDNKTFAHRQIQPEEGDLALALRFGRCASCEETTQVRFDVELPCDIQENEEISSVGGVRVVGNWAPEASWTFDNGLVLQVTSDTRRAGDFPIPLGDHEYLYSLSVKDVSANEDLTEEAGLGQCASGSFLWGPNDESIAYANRTLSVEQSPTAELLVVSDTAESCSTGCDISVNCGDGVCQGVEDATSCYADCGACGDGVCTAGEESVASCPDDCSLPFCGNGTCGVFESAATCPEDCGSAPLEPSFSLQWSSPEPASLSDSACDATIAGTSATCPLLLNASGGLMQQGQPTLEAQCASGALTAAPQFGYYAFADVDEDTDWRVRRFESSKPASLSASPGYQLTVQSESQQGSGSWNVSDFIFPHVPAELIQLTFAMDTSPADEEQWTVTQSQTVYLRADFCAPIVAYPASYSESRSFVPTALADGTTINVEVDIAGAALATVEVECAGGWGLVGTMSFSPQGEKDEHTPTRHVLAIPLPDLPPSALNTGSSLSCSLKTTAIDSADNSTTLIHPINITELDCVPDCDNVAGLPRCQVEDGCGGMCETCPKDCAEWLERLGPGGLVAGIYHIQDLASSNPSGKAPVLCTPQAQRGLTLAAVFSDDGLESWTWKGKVGTWAAGELDTAPDGNLLTEIAALNEVARDYKSVAAWRNVAIDEVLFMFRPLDGNPGRTGLIYELRSDGPDGPATLEALFTEDLPSSSSGSATDCEPRSFELVNAIQPDDASFGVHSIPVVDTSVTTEVGVCEASTPMAPMLCNTNLYIHSTDSRGQCFSCGEQDAEAPAHSYGFTWHVRGPNGCGFDQLGRYGSLGPNSAETTHEACDSKDADCAHPLGFAEAMGLRSPSSSGSYEAESTNDNVRLYLNRAICGNDIVEVGEQCDDGNTLDGDGCSHDCQVAATCQRQNPSLGQANTYEGAVYSRQNHYYVLCDEQVTYSFASGFFGNPQGAGGSCALVSGHLVKIEDTAENAWLLRQNVAGPALSSFWIGLDRQGTWQTSAIPVWYDDTPLETVSDTDLSWGLKDTTADSSGWSEINTQLYSAVFVNSVVGQSNYGLWGISPAGEGYEKGYVCEVPASD